MIFIALRGLGLVSNATMDDFIHLRRGIAIIIAIFVVVVGFITGRRV